MDQLAHIVNEDIFDLLEDFQVGLDGVPKELHRLRSGFSFVLFLHFQGVQKDGVLVGFPQGKGKRREVGLRVRFLTAFLDDLALGRRL